MYKTQNLIDTPPVVGWCYTLENRAKHHHVGRQQHLKLSIILTYACYNLPSKSRASTDNCLLSEWQLLHKRSSLNTQQSGEQRLSHYYTCFLGLIVIGRWTEYRHILWGRTRYTPSIESTQLSIVLLLKTYRWRLRARNCAPNESLW